MKHNQDSAFTSICFSLTCVSDNLHTPFQVLSDA